MLIVVTFVAVLTSVSATVLLWPFGWGLGLAGGPVVASLVVGILTLGITSGRKAARVLARRSGKAAIPQ